MKKIEILIEKDVYYGLTMHESESIFLWVEMSINQNTKKYTTNDENDHSFTRHHSPFAFLRAVVFRYHTL